MIIMTNREGEMDKMVMNQCMYGQVCICWIVGMGGGRNHRDLNEEREWVWEGEEIIGI